MSASRSVDCRPGALERPPREEPGLASLPGLAALAGGGDGEEILAVALRIAMAELGVERGALFEGGPDGRLAVRISHAPPVGAPASLGLAAPLDDVSVPGPADEARLAHGLAVLCPVHRRDRPSAVLGLGPLPAGREHGPEETSFLRGLAACAALAGENARVCGELRRVNRELSASLFQLHNLFDLSRDLAGGREEDAIAGLVATTTLGHFLVSRCALYRLGERGLTLVQERGLPREAAKAAIPLEQARAALGGLVDPRDVLALPEGPLRRRLEEARLVLVVPLRAGTGLEGILALGERASGTPFSEEDREFALSLARQAAVALENSRLERLRLEKRRRDEELRTAREIQRSLLPAARPGLPGFEIAAESRPCFEVGGDAYDWIPLGQGRLALVVADVSGKGTPASLLMASVHAYLRALAGSVAPGELVARLNRFLFESTQPSRFVTLFYAELDAAARRLAYVNAGHVPPYRVGADGARGRLPGGGPALGLLEDACFAAGEVELQPGDVLAIVTDGVTEAESPDGREFGDEGVLASLRSRSGAGAAASLAGLVADVGAWAGAAGCADDLTAMVLTATAR